jgi:RNA recognition motif-containing protein
VGRARINLRSPIFFVAPASGKESWGRTMAKLYVGNLAFDATDDALRELFSAKGIRIASAKVIRDMNTGQSRGFGFVELETGENCEKAIAQMNGTSLGGRTLQINEARAKAPSHGGHGGRDGGRQRSGGGRGRY